MVICGVYIYIYIYIWFWPTPIMYATIVKHVMLATIVKHVMYAKIVRHVMCLSRSVAIFSSWYHSLAATRS